MTRNQTVLGFFIYLGVVAPLFAAFRGKTDAALGIFTAAVLVVGLDWLIRRPVDGPRGDRRGFWGRLREGGLFPEVGPPARSAEGPGEPEPVPASATAGFSWDGVAARLSPRKQRLFAVACARRAAELIRRDEVRRALELGERLADTPTDPERQAALGQALAAVGATWDAERGLTRARRRLPPTTRRSPPC